MAVFHMQVSWTAFLFFQLDIVSFCQKNIGTKDACKMFLKLKITNFTNILQAVF